MHSRLKLAEKARYSSLSKINYATTKNKKAHHFKFLITQSNMKMKTHLNFKTCVISCLQSALMLCMLVNWVTFHYFKLKEKANEKARNSQNLKKH